MSTRARHANRLGGRIAIEQLVIAAIGATLLACCADPPPPRAHAPAPPPAEHRRSGARVRTIDGRRDAITTYRRLWTPIAHWLAALRAFAADRPTRAALQALLRSFDSEVEAHQLHARIEIEPPPPQTARALLVRVALTRRSATVPEATCALLARLRPAAGSPEHWRFEQLVLRAPEQRLYMRFEPEAGGWRQQVRIGERSRYSLSAPQTRAGLEALERTWLPALFALTRPAP